MDSNQYLAELRREQEVGTSAYIQYLNSLEQMGRQTLQEAKNTVIYTVLFWGILDALCFWFMNNYNFFVGALPFLFCLVMLIIRTKDKIKVAARIKNDLDVFIADINSRRNFD